MKECALKGAAVLLTALFLLMSAAVAEGYMLVFGSLEVYGDRELTELLGEIGDASIIYAEAAEDTGNGRVFTIIFGHDGVLRTGYSSGGTLIPLMPAEAEAYAAQAGDGMVHSGDVRLLNADFTPAREETGAEEDILFSSVPAASSSPAVSPLPWQEPEFEVEEEASGAVPSPIPTVTPIVTSAPVTLPPTPTRDPSSCVNIIVPPTDVSGYSGEEVVLAVGAEGARSYCWQYFDGSAWVDSSMEQASSPAMKLVVFEGGRERIYRCVITGTDGTRVFTEPVRIIVQR